MKLNELLERLIEFATNCAFYVGSLPKTLPNKIYGEQVLRSSSSPAANYAEAISSISKREWQQKIGFCRKESQESYVWLRLLTKLNATNRQFGLKLVDEATQLSKIFTAMSKTAKQS